MIDILLIEDSKTDAVTFERMLKKCSFENVSLEIAESLKEGVELLSTKDFSCIYLDLSLPDSNGMHTFIRLLESVQILPIVVITGYYNPDLRVKCLEAGAVSIIDKDSFTEAILRESLESVSSEELLSKY